MENTVALSAHPAASAAAAPPAAAACPPSPSCTSHRFLAADDLTPAERWQRHLVASPPSPSASGALPIPPAPSATEATLNDDDVYVINMRTHTVVQKHGAGSASAQAARTGGLPVKLGHGVFTGMQARHLGVLG